jgi:hypothetical protein
MNHKIAELESKRIENFIRQRGGVLNIAWRTVCMG